MAKKLSASKIAKIMEYMNAGYSQHHTAVKLHINQSTVCHYWNKFDSEAKAEGLEEATEKYGGGDVTEINTLAAELKEEGFTVLEAKAGLKVHQLLQKLEVATEDYESVIKACLKVNEKCFLETAAELDELEEKLGDSGLGVIANLEDTAKKLQQTHSELDQLYLLIKSAKKELGDLKEEKHVATQEFKQYMKYLGLTLHRLKLVEELSLKLKKAGIMDNAIDLYLKRQTIFDEAKLDMALFASIVTQAKIVTTVDGGKGLLGSLEEYNSLTAANTVFMVKQKTLKESIVGLQQQAELKGKLEGEVSVLAAEKATLEPYLEKLQVSKEEYHNLQFKIADSLEFVSEHTEKLNQMLQDKLELEKDSNKLVEKTKDLCAKAKQVIQIDQRLAEFEEEKKIRDDEWQSFLGFVALVQEQPLKGLEMLSEVLPYFIENVKKGEYKALIVRNHTVKTLTGTEFKLPMCYTCTNKMNKIEPPKPKSVPVVQYSIKVSEGTGPS